MDLLSRLTQSKIERMQKEGYISRACLVTEKTVEHESDYNTNCNWCSWNSHQRIDIRTGGPGKNGIGKDCPNCSIIEMGQNTEKSPGDLRWLAVTQTQVENHQLTIFTNPSARTGYDTRSILNRSLTGLNSEFSFS